MVEQRTEISIKQRGVVRSKMRPGEVAFGTKDIYYNPGANEAANSDGNGDLQEEKTFLNEVDPNDPRYSFWKKSIEERRRERSPAKSEIAY